MEISKKRISLWLDSSKMQQRTRRGRTCCVEVYQTKFVRQSISDKPCQTKHVRQTISDKCVATSNYVKQMPRTVYFNICYCKLLKALCYHVLLIKHSRPIRCRAMCRKVLIWNWQSMWDSIETANIQNYFGWIKTWGWIPKAILSLTVWKRLWVMHIVEAKAVVVETCRKQKKH